MGLLSLAFLLALFLVACGGNGDSGTGDEPDTNGETDVTEEPGENGADQTVDGGLVPAHIEALINRAAPSSDDVIDGGILRVALVTPTPFPGILNRLFSTNAQDGNIMSFFMGTGGGDILGADENFLIDDSGPATMEVSDDGLVVTFTIRDNVYWHDGEPVTARDWLLAYEVLGHPDYLAAGGQRFGQQGERSITGMMAYHQGTVDYIAGIEILSERVLQITFDEPIPVATTVFATPLPYHIFSEIPISEMETSEYVRTEAAIGFGPFILDHIVPGESITFVRNENYWQGAPILEGVELRVVSPETIGEEMRAGTVDMATTFGEMHYPYFSDLSNTTFLKAPTFVYNYIGFRLGTWEGIYDEVENEDGEMETVMIGGENVLDPDAVMANVDLRRALWMAIDNNMVGGAWRSNLRWEASAMVPPAFEFFHHEGVQRPEFNIEAANALLDEAGFTIGDDGYRMNPDGSPLVITYTAPIRDSAYEAIHQYYLTQWRQLHLNIDDTYLLTLDLTAFNAGLNPANEEARIGDIFTGAWSTGTNPSQYGLYGRTAAFNFSRYTSERMDQLLARIDSEESARDVNYRAEALREWQEYMLEVMPVIPTEFRFVIVPLNNRVVNYRINATFMPVDGLHLVGLTSETPYVD